MKCGKCNADLTIKPNKLPKSYHVTLAVQNPAGDSKSFDLLVSADGVWQVGSEIERAITESLLKDSDRSAAVVAGSMVEARLTDVIRTVCRHVPKLQERHLHPGGAFGNFSIKIDLAYMLRLITAEAYKDLMTVKEIRNAFAHRTDIQDFGSQWARDKTNNLKLIESHVGEHAKKVGSRIITFNATERPRMFVYGWQQRLKNPRDRYLTTTQLFMVCLAPGDLPDYPMPLI